LLRSEQQGTARAIGRSFFCAHRHCEERSDAAIQEHELDCFATLAMTRLVLSLIFLVAACRDDRPPAPNEVQSAQLNEMENSLNAMANNEEGPEANAPGPSNSSN